MIYLHCWVQGPNTYISIHLNCVMAENASQERKNVQLRGQLSQNLHLLVNVWVAVLNETLILDLHKLFQLAKTSLFLFQWYHQIKTDELWQLKVFSSENDLSKICCSFQSSKLHSTHCRPNKTNHKICMWIHILTQICPYIYMHTTLHLFVCPAINSIYSIS